MLQGFHLQVWVLLKPICTLRGGDLLCLNMSRVGCVAWLQSSCLDWLNSDSQAWQHVPLPIKPSCWSCSWSSAQTEAHILQMLPAHAPEQNRSILSVFSTEKLLAQGTPLFSYFFRSYGSQWSLRLRPWLLDEERNLFLCSDSGVFTVSSRRSVMPT